jgi:cellulose synthase/poly-beta-1,6-N-acetylglucosamine synthase-like glycosyltransferase
MIVDILLALLLLVLFFWLLAFPVSAWLVVHLRYPRRLRRISREPGFPVNVIVPCKGSNSYLEENLRAYASQDYPRYQVTFVTNTAEDEARVAIASVAQGNPRVRHLVAGLSETCASKVYAQIVAVESDAQSDVFLFGDSDMRPQPGWIREMVRPFLDSRVSVTTSHRWVDPDARGFAPSLYTVLSGFYCMYLAAPFLAFVWGGAFGISRRAYVEMGVTELWSTTASDDVALSNRMAAHHVRPFFVPRGVCASRETFHSLGALMSWYNRQSLTGKLHSFHFWLTGLTIETFVSLAWAGSLVLLVAEAVTGSLDYHALAAPVIMLSVAAGSMITKLTYPRRRDIPLWQWALLPLIGHFVVAASFWCSAFQRSMTWGSFTYTVDRDGKVARIDPGESATGRLAVRKRPLLAQRRARGPGLIQTRK